MTRCSFNRQRGATLLITLIMLVVLTLFAVTGFRLSSVNLKIAGNFQQQRFLEATIQQAVEQFLSTSEGFGAISGVPAGRTVTVNGITVTLSTPKCNYYAIAEGYGKEVGGVTPEDTTWEIRAVGEDTLGGAKTAIIQGVQMRLLADHCPST